MQTPTAKYLYLYKASLYLKRKAKAMYNIESVYKMTSAPRSATRLYKKCMRFNFAQIKVLQIEYMLYIQTKEGCHSTSDPVFRGLRPCLQLQGYYKRGAPLETTPIGVVIQGALVQPCKNRSHGYVGGYIRISMVTVTISK